jgi:hypothetical protein
VSDDGSIVMDEKRIPLGYIDGGTFKPMDKAHVELLRAKGYIK